MLERNPGCKLDLTWLENVNINLNAVKTTVSNIVSSRQVTKEHQPAWLLRAVTCIDLTTLAGDDTPSNVSRLCFKAAKPIAEDLLNQLGYEYGEKSPIQTAAVCVYPSRVGDAAKTLKKMGFEERINVASVATGFPTGQTPLKTRLEEIRYAVSEGATEIDIVINRTLALTGKWVELYEELVEMKKACGEAHLKSILAVGELGSLNNVYKASIIAMMAGSDFIKTSTGKEGTNATLPVGLVMAWAIKDYQNRFGYKVGLKPAGGIRTSQDAISWLIMIKEVLGNDWLSSELFRFGASGLLGDIEANLYKLVTGRSAEPHIFTMG